MTSAPRTEIARILGGVVAVDVRSIAAQRRVILRHREMGSPVIWRDGKVVEVAADTVAAPPGVDETDSPRPSGPRQPEPSAAPRRLQPFRPSFAGRVARSYGVFW